MRQLPETQSRVVQVTFAVGFENRAVFYCAFGRGQCKSAEAMGWVRHRPNFQRASLGASLPPTQFASGCATAAVSINRRYASGERSRTIVVHRFLKVSRTSRNGCVNVEWESDRTTSPVLSAPNLGTSISYPPVKPIKYYFIRRCFVTRPGSWGV